MTLLIVKKLLHTIKGLLLNHKKKFIGMALLVVLTYYIKKKMQIQHLVIIVDKILKFAQYLPLPQPPVYREVLPLSKQDPSTYKEILQFLNIQQLRKEIKKGKLELWDQVLKNVFIGFGLSITIFDIKQILNMFRQKYEEEFKELNAQQQFNKGINMLQQFYKMNFKKAFTLISEKSVEITSKLDIQKIYEQKQIYQFFRQIFQNIFHDKYRVSKLNLAHKNKALINKQVYRLFYTNLEKTHQKPSKIKKIWNWLGTFINVPQIFKETEFEISEQRFQIIRQLFEFSNQDLNKTRQLFDKHHAQELFQLVLKQIEDLFQSLNFHSFMYYYSQYQTQKFLNRLYLVLKTTQPQILCRQLSIFYKICKEQFIKEDCLKNNQQFLNSTIKVAFTLKVKCEDKDDKEKIEDLTQPNILLNQLEYFNRMQFAKNQLLLKYFHERSGIQVTKSNESMNNYETKQLLNMLSNQNKQ